MNRINQSPKVVSILSGKGGVGKSVISYALSDTLARMNSKVLIVDTDFNSGNLHFLANVRADFGITHYMNGELSLKEAVTVVNDNLDILASPGNREFVDINDVIPSAKLIENLRAESKDYDLIVIDHPSGISKSSTVIAHGSDLNLLVMVPELTSISDCYGLYKFLTAANSSIDCRLIMNRTKNRNETQYISQKFNALTSRFINHQLPLFGSLPESEDIRKSVMKQKPVFELDENSVVVPLLNNMARILVRELTAQSVDLVNLYDRNPRINLSTALADIKE